MIQSLYTAASGMREQQKNIDTIANNIANINTTGYKRSRANFKDAIYSTMLRPVDGGDDLNLQQGHGVLMGSVTKDLRGSHLIKTENALDFSIVGEGFFAVDNGEQILYTRDGSFKVSVEGDNTYLVTAEGYYVLSSNQERIEVVGNVNDLAVDLDGNIEGQSVKIGVFNFSNASGLYEAGSNKYAVSESSGDAFLVENAQVQQYYLEGSNVDLTDELTAMIRAQRAYQAAARAISTADEMEGVANNIRT
jgi:flagellar basal-body rod protein FlgG